MYLCMYNQYIIYGGGGVHQGSEFNFKYLYQLIYINYTPIKNNSLF